MCNLRFRSTSVGFPFIFTHWKIKCESTWTFDFITFNFEQAKQHP